LLEVAELEMQLVVVALAELFTLLLNHLRIKTTQLQ